MPSAPRRTTSAPKISVGDVKRQDQQAEKQPAPPQPHRQRRAKGPDHRQRRRAQQQAEHQPAIAPGGRFRSTPAPGAASVSGRPVTSQCASALTATTPPAGSARWPEGQASHPRGPARRSGRATEGRPAAPRPTGCPARCGPACRLGPTAQRHQHRHQEKEGKAKAEAAARAEGQPQVAQRRSASCEIAQTCHERPRQSRPAPSGGCGRGQVQDRGLGQAKVDMGGDDADPPSADARAPPRKQRDRGHVKADGGFVQKPDRAPVTRSRARPRRRFCPAESSAARRWQAAGPSRHGAVNGGRRRPRPRRPGFRRTVRVDFSPSAWAA
jgi:hypothetical protein